MPKNTGEIKVEKKVKCACPGCGIEFMESKGIKGDDGKLYCTKKHAEIALIINPLQSLSRKK